MTRMTRLPDALAHRTLTDNQKFAAGQSGTRTERYELLSAGGFTGTKEASHVGSRPQRLQSYTRSSSIPLDRFRNGEHNLVAHSAVTIGDLRGKPPAAWLSSRRSS